VGEFRLKLESEKGDRFFGSGARPQNFENASGIIEGAIATDLENGRRSKKEMLVDKTDPTRAERSEHEVRAAPTTGFACKMSVLKTP